MNGHLKSYQAELETLGPVFIGSGHLYTRKEYMFLEYGTKIGILDMQKAYALMRRRRKAEAFERYLLNEPSPNQRSWQRNAPYRGYEDLSRLALSTWLTRNDIRVSEILPCMKYVADAGTNKLNEQKGIKLQILEFIKDPMGCPYVPGSSIKGMLRTILLTDLICSARGKLDPSLRKLESAVDFSRNSYEKINRTRFLQNEIENLEADAFYTLNRNRERFTDQVNDSLAGLIISDSEPLSVDDLVMCQKVDRYVPGFTDRKGQRVEFRYMPLIRECLRPGTKIRFTISVNSALCDMTPEKLQKAIANFNAVYWEQFVAKFKTVPRRSDSVYLGGGTGFGTKTIIYPALREKSAKDVPVIFAKTGVPQNHQHGKDPSVGVSPHTLKETLYNGKTYLMGECRLHIAG